MIGRPIPHDDGTRRVDKAQARQYLLKAVEFHQTARSALGCDHWNSAGLASIHAGIGAADAALVSSAGLRSASRQHAAALELLRRQVSEYGAAQERQLRGLLALKNTVEYEQRLVTELEARSMTEQAERLVRWARDVVAAHLEE